MKPPRPLAARLMHRLARLVLRAYPARFRARFDAEVTGSMARDLDEAAAGGRWTQCRAAAHALADACGGLLPEHRRERRRRQAARARTGRPPLFSGLGEDVRQSSRALLASPGYTLVAVAVLGLAIGAATTVYSIVDAVVLRGLPFDRADRIVSVLEHGPGSGRPGGSVTPQTYLDWQAQQQSFEHLAAVHRTTFRLRNERGEPSTARAIRITPDFLPLLRVTPVLGRRFDAADSVPGAPRVVILSYGFWQRQYGGAPDAVGGTIELDDERWEIVGVMPRGFSYPVASTMAGEIFAPVAFRADDRVRGRSRNFVYAVVGRLKDGMSIAQARDEMNRIAAALDDLHPAWNPGGRVRIVTLHEAVVERVRSWMLTLLGAVSLVLLIACANVANLMLVRSTVRNREIGIRAALGASRWRIARALLTEGVMLAAAAAVVGMAIAWLGVGILRAWLPPGLPRVTSIALDLRVLTAAAGAAVVTGLLFGLAPAFQSSRTDLTLAFRDGRTSTAGSRGRRLRNLLVVVEVALAVVLLVGAGLFIASFVGLLRIETGFDHRNVLAVHVDLPFAPGDDFEERLRRGTPYVQEMLEAVRRAPGVVEAASVSGGLPLSGSWQSNPVEFPGRPPLTGGDREINTRWVSPDYLSVLRIPLLRGRAITPGDRLGAPSVVLVNQAAARHYWPDADALGERIAIDKREMTVVGIVGDIRHLGPETPVKPEAYVPLAQDRVLGAALVMRTEGDPLAALPAVKAAIWSVNPEQRFNTDIFTLEGHMDRLIAQRRFNMSLLVIFGGLGLVIAAAGIYGVMAYAVAQRTAEIGVRMALGATRRQVMSMILRHAGALMGLGLAIGLIGARYLGAAVRAFLFQVEPTDARVLAAALATLLVAGLVASAVPARRAAAVDPVVALRSQ